MGIQPALPMDMFGHGAECDITCDQILSVANAKLLFQNRDADYGPLRKPRVSDFEDAKLAVTSSFGAGFLICLTSKLLATIL